jgi:hypothetical protein
VYNAIMRVLTLIVPLLLLAGIARAAEPSALCETAIASAEYAGHLPPRILSAIAMVESGRFDETSKAVRPWPWTINAEGEGHYFTSKGDAIGAVRALQMRGVRSIDVGCLQVNLMHHPDAFGSLDEAFEPTVNAAYAAQFLNRLHAPSDDWSHAIGAYHSATPALGDAYRALVMLRWNGPHPTFAAVPQPSVYHAFQPAAAVYGSFAPASLVYGAFAAAGASRPPARYPPRMLLASAQPPHIPGPNGRPGSPPSLP